jgi:hypothetical protein
MLVKVQKTLVHGQTRNCGGHFDSVSSTMCDMVGKKIAVNKHPEKWRGWYRGADGVGFNWHYSWLIFSNKERGLRPNKRFKLTRPLKSGASVRSKASSKKKPVRTVSKLKHNGRAA